MRVVVALRDSALLPRQRRLTAADQREHVRAACRALAPVAAEHELVVSHDIGPQAGLLALQGAAYAAVDAYPLDLLGAQTDGMIGYLLQQELGNELPPDRRPASVLTLVEVDPGDRAFAEPATPIGPVYTRDETEALRRSKGWAIKADGGGFRRVVPAPLPRRIFGLEPVEWLLDRGCVVICAGIPVMHVDEPVPAGRRLVGVEAVLDEDVTSALLAAELGADAFVIVTDLDAVYLDWGGPRQRAVRRASPGAFAAQEFAAGPMGPKIRAACAFVERTGGMAAIGSISDAADLVRGTAGTVVARDAAGVELIGAN